MTHSSKPFAPRMTLDARAVRPIPSPSPFKFPPFVDALDVREVHDFNVHVSTRYLKQFVVQPAQALAFSREAPPPALRRRPRARSDVL